MRFGSCASSFKSVEKKKLPSVLVYFSGFRFSTMKPAMIFADDVDLGR